MEVRVAVVAVPLRVDDCAVEAHAGRDRLYDVVGALRKLKVDGWVDLNTIEVADPDIVHLVLAEGHDVGLAAGASKAVTPHAPDSRIHLAGDEEWEQIAQCIGEEAVFDLYEVVFVASESVAAEVVDRIVMEADALIQSQVLEDRSAGTVMGDEVFEVGAFRRGVLFVAAYGVDIEPSSVPQEPACPRRLEGVVACVEVDQAESLLVERMVLYGLDDLF